MKCGETRILIKHNTTLILHSRAPRAGPPSHTRTAAANRSVRRAAARSANESAARPAEWLSALCDWLPGGGMVVPPPIGGEDPGAKRGINFQLIVV